MRVLAAIIFLAILFFSGRAIWDYFNKNSFINAAAKEAANEIIATSDLNSSLKLGAEAKQENTSTTSQETKAFTNENSKNPIEEVSETAGIEVISGITQLPYPPVIRRLDRKVIAELEGKYASEKAKDPNYTITESGSSPAVNTIAKVQTPLSFLSYELNSVSVSEDGNLRVAWKLRNTSDKEIVLNRDLRQLLSPTRLYVVDFRSQRRFAIKYDGQIPVANCLLADSISPYGRIDCTALVGPVLRNNGGLSDDKVLVYLPGKMTPVRVFLNI